MHTSTHCDKKNHQSACTFRFFPVQTISIQGFKFWQAKIEHNIRL